MATLFSLSTSEDDNVEALSGHTTSTSRESAPTSEEAPQVPSLTSIRLSLFQCGGAASLSASTKKLNAECVPKKRDYRGDLLLPCRGGTTYAAWIHYLEQQLVQYAVFHAEANASPSERADVQSFVEADGDTRATPNGSLCTRCFRLQGADTGVSCSARQDEPSSRRTSSILQVVQLYRKRKGTDKQSERYELVPPSQWDMRIVERETEASGAAPREKFRVFFCVNASSTERLSCAPSSDSYNAELVYAGQKLGISAPFTVEVVDKTTQAKRTWRLAAEGPTGNVQAALSSSSSFSGKRESTLQESIIQRLSDTRGLHVERVADRETGVALLPSCSSSVAAALFPHLCVQVEHYSTLHTSSARTPPVLEEAVENQTKRSGAKATTAKKKTSLAPTWEKALESANAHHYGLRRHHPLRPLGVVDEEESGMHGAEVQTLISMSDFTDTLSDDTFGLGSTETNADVSAIRDVANGDQYASIVKQINTIDSESRQHYVDLMGENSNATTALSHRSFGNDFSNVTSYNPLSGARPTGRTTGSQRKPSRPENIVYFTSSSSSSSASPVREEPVLSAPLQVERAPTQTPTPTKPIITTRDEASRHRGDSLHHINDAFVYEVDDEEPSRSATKNSTPSRGKSRGTPTAPSEDTAAPHAKATPAATPVADAQPGSVPAVASRGLPHLHTSTPRVRMGAKMGTPSSQPPRLLEAIINSQRKASPFTMCSQTPPAPGGASPFEAQRPKSYYCYSPAPTQLVHKRDELDTLPSNHVSPYGHSNTSSTVVHERLASRGAHAVLPFQTAESIAERIMRGNETMPATQLNSRAHPGTLDSAVVEDHYHSLHTANAQSSVHPTPPRRVPIYLEMEDLLGASDGDIHDNGDNHDDLSDTLASPENDNTDADEKAISDVSEREASIGSEGGEKLLEEEPEREEETEEEEEEEGTETTSSRPLSDNSNGSGSGNGDGSSSSDPETSEALSRASPRPKEELIAELSEGDMEEYHQQLESHSPSAASQEDLSVKRLMRSPVDGDVFPNITKRTRAEATRIDEEDWTSYSPMVVTQQDLPVYVGMDSEEEDDEENDSDQYVHLP